MPPSGIGSSSFPLEKRTDPFAGSGMKLPRRRFLHLATGAVLPALPRIAHADAYPSRPVRMLVGSTAGAAPDVVARLFSQWLWERLGQPFVVETRPAGGGNLAAEPVVRAPPD